MSQQFGQRLTHEQAKALGIDNQVLAQLVSGAVLDEQARKLGLGLSKDRLAELTREDPAFKGPGGEFDRRTFEYMLGGAAGAYRDTVLMNAGAGLVIAGKTTTLADGIALAAQAIDSGRALQVLDRLVEISNG